MNGMDYKYIFVKTQGIQISNESRELNGGRVNSGPGITSLVGIKDNTVIGAVDFKQASGLHLTITGGTELLDANGDSYHKGGPKGHSSGLKLDFRLSSEVNDYIVMSYPFIKTRSDGAKGYKDGYSNEFWKEGNHWDVVFNESYTFSNFE